MYVSQRMFLLHCLILDHLSLDRRVKKHFHLTKEIAELEPAISKRKIEVLLARTLLLLLQGLEKDLLDLPEMTKQKKRSNRLYYLDDFETCAVDLFELHNQ